MNRSLFTSIVAAAMFLLLLLLTTPDASGCNRCGLFGRRCHFAQAHHVPHVVHHAAPVYHAPPANIQNFIFNSQYPGPYYPAGGNSLFGYSLAAQAHYVDPAQVLDRAARFTELALQQSSMATGDYKALGAQALALNDQFNQRQTAAQIASVAIAALQSSSTPSPHASVLKVTVNSAGDTKAEWTTPENGAAALGVTMNCANCHNKAAGQVPGDFFFDGKTISVADFDWASEAIWSGKMPKGQKLERAQKAELVGKLRRLLPPAEFPLD